MDLTLQCHCRVSRVRAVQQWRGVPPACRGQRVSPANGVTGAIKAPRETRVHQVDYHESHSTAAGNRREKRRICAEKTILSASAYDPHDQKDSTRRGSLLCARFFVSRTFGCASPFPVHPCKKSENYGDSFDILSDG